MTDEEWKAKTRRAGKARAQKRREGTPAMTEGKRPEIPGPSLARALEVVGELLDMTIPGSPEPNYEARAFGVFALAQLFRVRDKEEALELLARVRPKVAADSQVYRLRDFESARARLIEAYEEGRISAEELPPGLLECRV